MAAVAERVAGVRALQLRHRAQIAGVQLRYRQRLFALHDGQMRQLFLRLLLVIEDRIVDVRASGKYFEEGNLSRKRIGNCFENE